MRELFYLDQHDYKEDGKQYSRPSVRGIIIQDGKVLLVHSEKYDYLKFPGGGIEDGENHVTRYTLHQQEEENPMVTPEAITFWNKKTRITRQFVNALRQDVVL